MTTAAEIQALLDRYVEWLRDRTSLRELRDWVEITTPYLDRHNDHLQIYVAGRDGSFVLTDDGATLHDLEMSGCRIDTPKRRGLLELTLRGFGVGLNDERLEVVATSDSFASRKHNLVQAMLAVNDMFYLAQPTVATLFYEDVVAWLDLHEVRYTPRVKFSGKTGYDHLFDFVVPKSQASPERILKALARPSKDTAEAAVFAWLDTRDVRDPDSTAYAILNDAERNVGGDVLEALSAYSVRPVLWSRRDEVVAELAA